MICSAVRAGRIFDSVDSGSLLRPFFDLEIRQHSLLCQEETFHRIYAQLRRFKLRWNRSEKELLM